MQGSTPAHATMQGFRGMLSDRLTFVVDTALKMCRAKGRWVEHVWKTQINIYVKHEDKRQAVFKILGKKYNLFDFRRSIDFDNIEPDEREYWEYVASWVEWLQKNNLFLYEVYQSSLEKGLTDGQIISLFTEKYKIKKEKAKILINAYKTKY